MYWQPLNMPVGPEGDPKQVHPFSKSVPLEAIEGDELRRRLSSDEVKDPIWRGND